MMDAEEAEALSGLIPDNILEPKPRKKKKDEVIKRVQGKLQEPNRVTARIEARKTARELMGLLSWEAGTGAAYMEALLDELQKQLLLNLSFGDKPVKREAPPIPIGRLGNTGIGFGKYQGQTFDEIPLEYLDWLCKNQEEFYKELRAYLTHPDLKSHRGE